MTYRSCQLHTLKLGELGLILRKIIHILIALSLIASFLTPSEPAFAQGEGPEDPATGAAGKMLQIFISLGKLFINIAYGFMFLIFAVGSVKSGLGAQAAQQFGATGRVSLELLNLAGGVVIFIFGLMTLPLVNMIIRAVSEQFVVGGGWDFNIEIPVPIPGEGG
jgi:hypothetical protein